jgi:hypothetical protein
MQFEVTMRDGSLHQVEASYLEVVEGPTSSSYTLLGPVPGYPTAILAVFPAVLVQAITPVKPAPFARRQRADRPPKADERPADVPSAVDDFA